LIALRGDTDTDRAIDCSSVAVNARAELSPVCAVVGGVVAQEAIKLLTRVDEPLRNTFLYDSTTGEGVVEALGL
jgi:ubiquitin-like 1-activating enzyme E1 A